MTGPLRQAAQAFLLATVVALACDALLATLTRLVDVTGPAGSGPWWVAAHLVERGRWVVLAGLVAALLARSAGADAAAPVAGAATWRLVGMAVIAGPFLWIVATWIVQATLFTAAGRWDIDGQMFLSAEYYRRLLMGYAPWLLGGAATIAASRHVG